MNKLFLILSALLVIGCTYTDLDNNTKWHQKNIEDDVYIITVEKHKYVIYNGGNKGGIIHAESCWCKNKKEEEK